MPQVLLGVFLVVSSSIASAEGQWVKIDGDQNSTAYVNSEVIPENNPIHKTIKVWELIDYKAPKEGDNFTYSSELFQSRLICDEQTAADLYHAFKSQNMGKGESIQPTNIQIPEQMPIEPDSWLKKVWSYACNK